MTHEEQELMELCEAAASAIRRIVKYVHTKVIFRPPLIISCAQTCSILDLEAFTVRNPNWLDSTNAKDDFMNYQNLREKEHGL